jgi:GR25 family glycosyltransferase involved in LPS biosynthesis
VHIYIIHVPDNIRTSHCNVIKQRITDCIGVDNVTFTYVGENNTVASIVGMSKEELSVIADNRVIPGAPESLNSLVIKQYTPEQLSNAMNHRDAIAMIAASTTPSLSIVLEDDVQFCEEFNTSFQTLVQLLVASETLGYVHLGHIAHNRIIESEANFLPSHGMDVMSCESYYVSKRVATRMMTKFYPIRFKTPTHLAHVITSCGEKMHLYNRRTFTDGSKCGVFSSTICENNKHVYDEAYMSVYKAVTTGVDTSLELLDSRFLINPDYIYLRAMLMENAGDVKGAAIEMKRAMSEHTIMGSNITKRSNFLIKYIDMCRILAISNI